jgi:hypothetical protein
LTETPVESPEAARAPSAPAGAWRWFLLVAAAALIAYARSFTVPFQFDDIDQIVENPVLREPTASRLFLYAKTRIVPFASLAFNFRLGGESPVGYHVVNFAIHLLACLFVFRLALALTETPRLRDAWTVRDRIALATAAALVFACHPIQIQAVTYVVQRISSLATLFYVACVWSYVSARNRALMGDGRGARWTYLASLGLAVGALFSKENAISLPVAVLLAEFTFYHGSLRRRFGFVLAFGGLALAAPAVWFWFLPKLRRFADPAPTLGMRLEALRFTLGHLADTSNTLSPRDYFLTQCTVIPQYLRLVFLPWGFNIDHDIAALHGLTPQALAGLALLVSLLGVGGYALRAWPLLGFGILWVFTALSVESGVIPIDDLMMEHRMYLAMPGVALVLGAAYVAALRRRPRLATAAGAAIAAALVALTLARNEVWRSPLALWSDTLAKSPHKARVQLNVGVYLQQAGDLDAAIGHYCTALEIDPANRVARRNAGAAARAKLDRDLEQGSADEGVDLDLGGNGAQGVVYLTHRDPCWGR